MKLRRISGSPRLRAVRGAARMDARGAGQVMGIFENRTDAGRQLAAALKPYRGSGALVLGIPRGGVEVAHQIAMELALDLSLLVVRKLPFPDNPEAGFGALAEDGSLYFQPGASRRLPPSVIRGIVQEQRAEAARRVEVLRGGDPLPGLRQRHVILVDDGIAMGSTTLAAVKCCRGLGASRVTVAAPVASRDARTSLEATADEVIVLLCPPFFRAVAEFYRDWYDVQDEEVIGIMAEARQSGLLAEENHPSSTGLSPAPPDAGPGRDIAPGGAGSGRPCVRPT